MTNSVGMRDNFLNLSQFSPISELQSESRVEQTPSFACLKVWSNVRSLLHTLMITCEMKQPGALVKDVRKIPLEYSNLSASVAAQGTGCQHRAAKSCKIWPSSGKTWTICLSFWHLLRSILSSFNKNKACFACQASWLILVMALVKHKEFLDKKELPLKTLKNVNGTRSLQV